MNEIYIGNRYSKEKNVKEKYGILLFDDELNILFLLYKNFYMYPTFACQDFSDAYEAFSQYFELDKDKLVKLVDVKRKTKNGLLITHYFCYNSNSIRASVLNNISNYDLVNIERVIESGDFSYSNMERVNVARQLQNKMEYKVY